VDSSHFNPRSSLMGPNGPTSEVKRQFLGNGLADIDVNVIQMARAYAGLWSEITSRLGGAIQENLP
jgi:hypothetical protein